MPPKKNDAVAAVPESITGFNAKETKMIAAAFVSATGLDKYDYELFASLTGNTIGSLKKMWPPVKRKVMEMHPSFATFLGSAAAAGAGGNGGEGAEGKAKANPKPKATNAKKRKTPSTEPEDDIAKEDDPEAANEGKKKTKAPAKGRKKAASAEADDESNKEVNPDEAAKDGKTKAPAKGRKKAGSAEANADGEGDKKPAAKRGKEQVKTEETEEAVVQDEIMGDAAEEGDQTEV
ncbi:hypothetical protein BU23DRAFT_42092 [Bimuria novae-zelandiae CBS 107.79]|uniref:Uncharacterized protein n=1 Tax=Bimuria novae-zelandiae CBS 107.79 TaxID=1447943 RepID=A0A6A5VGI1_9PLEO|nr:hypothetical protein BU23DRAFT_42092 [Bimuria novae-zelandiae CBS 107.79]